MHMPGLVLRKTEEKIVIVFESSIYAPMKEFRFYEAVIRVLNILLGVMNSSEDLDGRFPLYIFVVRIS